MAYLWLRNLQVSHLDSAGCEVRNLEFDIDRSLALAGLSCTAHATAITASHATAVLVVALDGGQAELSAHQELFPAAELLDLPDDGRLLRRIVHCADVGTEPW